MTILPNSLTPPSPTNFILAPPFAAYPYGQYSDDDNIQALFMAYNNYVQSQYIDYFNQYNLAVYTETNIVGALLDWIGQGIYGLIRPYVSSGQVSVIGTYDTGAYDYFYYNELQKTGVITTLQVTDDIYKRCMTWNLYKGDGYTFSIKWLKKRVIRWLIGQNGAPLPIDSTYNVSVTVSNLVFTITIKHQSQLTNNALPGNFLPNQVTPDASSQSSSSGSFTLSLALVFQVLMNSGMLVLPAQYSYVVVVE